MKKLNKQTLKYIGAAFMCFFSLFAVCAAALAWFMENRTVGSSQTVSGNYYDAHASFFVYKFTKDYNGDATDVDLELDGHPKYDLGNLKLNTYDTIFIHQNAYTGALVRIHLYGKDVPTATAQDSKTVSIEITRNTSAVDPDPDDPNDITTYKLISSGADFAIGQLSNYNSFTTYSADQDLDNITDISAFMQAADAYFKAGINPTPPAAPTITPSNFVIEDAVNGNSKHDSITLTLQYTSVTVINNVNHINILLYINYNESLIEKFIENDDFTEINGLGANDVTLANDLDNLVVSVE